MHNVHPQLAPLLVDISTLTPDPKNARRHDERDIAATMESYAKHGQRKPIVVQRRDDMLVIRAGNGQTEAAKRLGWTQIAAVTVDESDEEALAFALRDNRTAELSEWDLGALGDSLRTLRDAGIAPDEVGWQPWEAEPLMQADWSPPGISGDDFNIPDRRISLMFSRDEWEALQNLIGAKPIAADVVFHIERMMKVKTAVERLRDDYEDLGDDELRSTVRDIAGLVAERAPT